MNLDALFGQLTVGLINGSFYALLSLGLAVIFGMLNIVNFAHGAQYMLGAYVSWVLLTYAGLGYWWSLLLAPILTGLFGVLLERALIRRLYDKDHLYGLLLTFGLALVIQGLARIHFGSAGLRYNIPEELTGIFDFGFMVLPIYRGWVIVFSLAACLAAWAAIEKTKLGSYLRAATENPVLVGAFGINVPLLITITYGAGVALAALAGVLAAPIFSVSPNMGIDILNVVFAVVVIGGMGSIGGAVVTGLALGVIEGLTKYAYPPAANVIIFIVMIFVLIARPEGLFGKMGGSKANSLLARPDGERWWRELPAMAKKVSWTLLILAAVAAPFFVYPVFAMKILCFALFACAFNLLLGYGGLLSFGHAAYFGSAAYIAGYALKQWGLSPELAVLLAVFCSSLLGLVFGAIAIKRQGVYFAMITLALGQLVFFACVQLKATGGEDGLQGVPRNKLFGLISLENNFVLYYILLAVVAAAIMFIYRVVHSPFGQVIKAIRENEDRAVSLGYRVNHFKVVLFTLAAALAGLAGALKSSVFQVVSLVDVGSGTSAEVVMMTLVGGIGTMFGPAVGAIIVTTMEYYLAPFGAWVTVIQGVIFVICVMSFREGIVGVVGSLLDLYRGNFRSEQQRTSQIIKVTDALPGESDVLSQKRVG
jgi:branched-chain amino acid transport system permease protein